VTLVFAVLAFAIWLLAQTPTAVERLIDWSLASDQGVVLDGYELSAEGLFDDGLTPEVEAIRAPSSVRVAIRAGCRSSRFGYGSRQLREVMHDRMHAIFQPGTSPLTEGAVESVGYDRTGRRRRQGG